jgi:hypothetical protein
MIKFREKIYSFQDLVSNIQAGALAAGTISSVIINNKDIIKNPFLKKILLGTSIGVAVISGLSMLAEFYNKKKSVSEVKKSINYNLNQVIDILTRNGYIENKDFFTDPKKADQYKTKVSIILRRDLGTMDLIVNTTYDAKLDRVTRSIFKEIPSESSFFKKSSENKIEIIVSSIDVNSSPDYMAEVSQKFIEKKIPVYLLEINR